MADEVQTCQKCGQTFPEWADADHEMDQCPYVQCDDPACRALREPLTYTDYIAAYEHWRRHHLYHGCSHGN